ncbi:hypothetical protein K435DRAFT_630422, partial [Dendrothele bispora CBS 962.96]
MISTMCPDIDHADEYMRNMTTRVFSWSHPLWVYRSLLPFFRSVCHSKKSWQARHTGIRIVQQITIVMSC